MEDKFTVVVLDVSEPNQPYGNLYSIADLKVMENLPIGTVVGTNATDPEGRIGLHAYGRGGCN